MAVTIFERRHFCCSGNWRGCAMVGRDAAGGLLDDPPPFMRNVIRMVIQEVLEATGRAPRENLARETPCVETREEAQSVPAPRRRRKRRESDGELNAGKRLVEKGVAEHGGREGTSGDVHVRQSRRKKRDSPSPSQVPLEKKASTRRRGRAAERNRGAQESSPVRWRGSDMRVENRKTPRRQLAQSQQEREKNRPAKRRRVEESASCPDSSESESATSETTSRSETNTRGKAKDRETETRRALGKGATEPRSRGLTKDWRREVRRETRRTILQELQAQRQLRAQEQKMPPVPGRRQPVPHEVRTRPSVDGS